MGVEVGEITMGEQKQEKKRGPQRKSLGRHSVCGPLGSGA
jgi:hypothetical protein